MAALIAAGPLLLKGPSCNGDLIFHYMSWIDAQHSISTGLLYPHWANSANFGAGQPEFVFYPPISWMGGAILGMLLPWTSVPPVLCVLSLLATGFANRALARQVLGEHAATLAGCAAIFLGYALFNVYKRNDFSELTGGFWIPLLLLFVLRRRNLSENFWERTFDGSATALALVVAGIWLSNGPLGIMAAYLLAAVALVCALTEKSLVPIARAAFGQTLGMGLASIYLIPAISESKWASIQNALLPDRYGIKHNWLFARNSSPALASHDQFLHQVSVVAVVMLSIALLGGIIAWLRGVLPLDRRVWIPMAVIPAAILFLLLPISQPIWTWIPYLRILQFPWRWLVVLEAPMAIWFALAIWSDRRSARVPVIAASAVLFAGISILAQKWWWTECGTQIEQIAQSASEGILLPGMPEYAPPGIRSPVLSVVVDAQGNPLVDPLGQPVLDSNGKPLLNSVSQHVLALPNACLLETDNVAPEWSGEASDCDGSGWQQLFLATANSSNSGSTSRPEQKFFMGFAKHAGYLILRLRNYPAWSVKVNGIPATPVVERQRGLMAVPVPQGPVQVSAEWTTTSDVILGRSVTSLALLSLICLRLFERKRLRAAPRLSPRQRSNQL